MPQSLGMDSCTLSVQVLPGQENDCTKTIMILKCNLISLTANNVWLGHEYICIIFLR